MNALPPSYNDREGWISYTAVIGIVAMMEATMSTPAIRPPVGHGQNLATQFQAVLRLRAHPLCVPTTFLDSFEDGGER